MPSPCYWLVALVTAGGAAGGLLVPGEEVHWCIVQLLSMRRTLWWQGVAQVHRQLLGVRALQQGGMGRL